MIQCRYSIIVELGGYGPEYRHIFRRPIPFTTVALNLLSHLPNSVVAAPLFKLIHHDQVGKIKHFNLFQLGRGTELGCHHIGGQVHQFDNFGVSLANSCGLYDYQVETCSLQHFNGIPYGLRQLGA